MEELTASDFELASCQATVFTPDGDLSVSKVMKELYPSLASLFDGEPTIPVSAEINGNASLGP